MKKPTSPKIGSQYPAQPNPFLRNAPSKIGHQVSTNRTIASSPPVSPKANNSEHRSLIDTVFTKPGDTSPIYQADRLWARVTLTLETAGPVAVGTAANLQPVLSGVGQLLTTGVPITFTLAKGNILYVAATGVNRISRTIEPFPWLEAIVGLIEANVGAISPAVLAAAKNQH